VRVTTWKWYLHNYDKKRHIKETGFHTHLVRVVTNYHLRRTALVDAA
jgi:hypothetical protein